MSIILVGDLKFQLFGKATKRRQWGGRGGGVGRGSEKKSQLKGAPK